MTPALIGLGSNLGDSGRMLLMAERRLGESSGVRVVARSQTHTTRAVGGPAGQPPFLNAAMTLETSLTPLELLAMLQTIEAEAGRRRDIRWGARTLDLDLLLYGDAVIDRPGLQVPHPRLSFRRFVLTSAVEIAGDWRHPAIGWTLHELLAHLDATPRHVALVADDEPCLRAIVSDLVTIVGSEWTIETNWPDGDSKPRLVVDLQTNAAPAENPRAAAARRRLQRGDCGPVLVLRDVDRSTAVEEIAAAMRATEP